ncbi:MAG: porin [Gammaproteobacteria bacterium]|nr:porin [Gammaproteobacteria bacterium]MCP5298652.1 porin [Chromatiaceae bacterium]
MRNCKQPYVRLGGVALAILASRGAMASGFNVPEISIAGTGTSNALVANHKLLGAIPYNPSLSAFHGGTTIAGGINIVHAESEVTPAIGTHAEFQGDDDVPIPNLQITHQLANGLTLGFGVNAPFGLSTNYPLGTFGVLAAVDPAGPVLGPGALQPTESKVEIVDVAPTLAFRLGENSAVAIGANYYWAREIVFDTQEIKNNGDGSGWGWNISASHVAGPWSFGGSFHSQAKVEIEGTSVIGLAGSAPATADLTVPWRAQIGARYQVNQQLAVEADISRIGWSSFDTLRINNAISPIVSTNNWDDTNAYRLGATYDLDSMTQLRFGYTRDFSGSDDDRYSARTADSDRHLFSIGVGHKIAKDMQLEAAYMYVKFDDRTLNSATPFGTYGSDANGTSAYNGTYETTVHILGIGLSKSFDL